MTQIRLSDEQRQVLQPHIERFRAYLSSDGFREDQQERSEHVRFFQQILPARLAELAESDVAELVENLWSTRMWGNRAYLVQTIVSDNGLDTLKHELGLLLDGFQPVGERYEGFVKRVKRLGPAAASEMLTYLQPTDCGIWNQKARQGLRVLGLSEYVNVGKYALSGPEYTAFNTLLGAIAEELRQAGVEQVDLLLVDYFLYEVIQQTEPPDLTVPEDFDHNEMRDIIAGVGEMLGFDTNTEVQVAHGAKVDVVWRARIGNLGMVTYVFEVHKSGSIDSLVMNLQKAKGSPTVQRVVAVSSASELDRIKRESEGLPAEFCKALGFWSVGDVTRVSQGLQSAVEIIDRLGLVKEEF